MAILIKRYANRKLYNTQTSRYITLKGIAELIDEGEEVRVIDNETGEDITSVALSQILVDTERSNSDVSGSLLSQILGRGGDALYDALRKGVDDASENIGEFQDRFRRFVARDGDSNEDGSASRERDHRSFSDWIAFSSPPLGHRSLEPKPRARGRGRRDPGEGLRTPRAREAPARVHTPKLDANCRSARPGSATLFQGSSSSLRIVTPRGGRSPVLRMRIRATEKSSRPDRSPSGFAKVRHWMRPRPGSGTNV
jgi:polyhydroxyalkanoate synthesis repressor PhaR